MSGGLVQRVEAFLREADMPVSVFGRAVVNDPRLVSDLRKGRELGNDMIDRIEAFMRKWREAHLAGRVQRVGDRRRRRTLAPDQLAEEALRAAKDDPHKAIELLREAIEEVKRYV